MMAGVYQRAKRSMKRWVGAEDEQKGHRSGFPVFSGEQRPDEGNADQQHPVGWLR